MSRELKLQTIQDLDRIADAHVQWMSGYHRALLCGVPHGDEVTAADAPDTCPFGRWFSQLDLGQFQPWLQQLKRMEQWHRQMHERAAELAVEARHGPLQEAAYDSFAEHAYRFKTSVRALQMKLMRDVCLVDHLTGVWNRSSLIQRISEECERMQRYGGSCSLCMMDIDYFKLVNDRYGHAAGDRVLQAVAGIAQRRLRRFDSIFRYGGEEFLLCLPKTTIDEALVSIERIRRDIADALVAVDDGVDISVTASFGVASLLPAAAIDDAIDTADQALFIAKATGRNKVCTL